MNDGLLVRLHVALRPIPGNAQDYDSIISCGVSLMAYPMICYYMYEVEIYVSLSTGTLSTRCCNGFLVRLALGPSLGDTAIRCDINTSGYTCMVYMYCCGYYVFCKASTIDFQIMLL